MPYIDMLIVPKVESEFLVQGHLHTVQTLGASQCCKMLLFLRNHVETPNIHVRLVSQ